jgi:hypothetical protein
MRGTWQTTDSGGGGLVLAVIAAAALIGSGAASAIASALVMILIVLGVVIVLAAAAGITWLVLRARRAAKSAPAVPVSAPPAYQLAPGIRLSQTAARPPAIEPPRELHVHLHGLTPDQLAAIITQRGTRGGDER